ncbi:MAG: hypothetical protein LBP60_08635, partial [Spirochaetaceae bacterium]|nr:hypothetical protein [Spirochaetaceae bacterium]
MGLLSKAATNPSPPALDEMGAVLCSRLLSLGPGSTRAETAMTLLKAYGSFSAGLCLVLKEGSYVLYASVGAGTGAAGFSQEGLSPLQGKTYYSVDYTISGDFDPSPLRFWAFPLVPVQDRYPQAILMVGENQDSFSGETIEAVLEKAGEVFLPPEDAGNVSEAKLPEVELHPTDSFEATPFTMEGLDENSFDIEAEL